MDFDELVAKNSAGVQKVARQLRKLVLSELPTANETIPAGESAPQAVYWIDQPSNVICIIVPASKGCQIEIHNLEPSDSEVFNIEGDHGNRTITFSEPLDADEADELTRLIHLSAQRSEAPEV